MSVSIILITILAIINIILFICGICKLNELRQEEDDLYQCATELCKKDRKLKQKECELRHQNEEYQKSALENAKYKAILLDLVNKRVISRELLNSELEVVKKIQNETSIFEEFKFQYVTRGTIPFHSTIENPQIYERW